VGTSLPLAPDVVEVVPLEVDALELAAVVPVVVLPLSVPVAPALAV
jgi:hypothetical protein